MITHEYCIAVLHVAIQVAHDFLIVNPYVLRHTLYINYIIPWRCDTNWFYYPLQLPAKQTTAFLGSYHIVWWMIHIQRRLGIARSRCNPVMYFTVQYFSCEFKGWSWDGGYQTNFLHSVILFRVFFTVYMCENVDDPFNVTFIFDRCHRSSAADTHQIWKWLKYNRYLCRSKMSLTKNLTNVLWNVITCPRPWCLLPAYEY